MPAARAEPGTAARILADWADNSGATKTLQRNVTEMRREKPLGTVTLDDVARRPRATPLLDALALLKTQHVQTGSQRCPQGIPRTVREQQREARSAGRLLGDVITARPAVQRPGQRERAAVARGGEQGVRGRERRRRLRDPREARVADRLIVR